MNYIEKYLDNFWTINENAPLAEGKISTKGGVIKEGDSIVAVPFKATGKVSEGQMEIGYGHLITSNDKENGFLAITSTGERYRIPYSDDIKLSQKQTKDIARADIITRIPTAKNKIAAAGGNYDEFNDEKKMLALDYELNVGKDKKGNSGIAAFPNFFKGIIENKPEIALSEFQRSSDGKLMTKRNNTTKELILDALNIRQPATIAKKEEEPKEVEVEVSEVKPAETFKQAFAAARGNREGEFTFGGKKYNTRLREETPQQYAAFLSKDKPVQVAKKGGPIEKDPYKRQPRFI